MKLVDELLEIERGFWESSTQPAYYRQHMADTGVAIFAGAVMDKSAAVAAAERPEATGWTDIELTDTRLVVLGDLCAALVYAGSAMQAGQRYRANVGSVYVRSSAGKWQLVLHQQSEAADA